MKNKFDLIVVGGGLDGLTSAYKIQMSNPKMRILIIEKEKDLAFHQSGRNSGVLHSGLYYKPGSYRAKNCVEGRLEMVEFSRKHGVNHDVCGKLVVATNPSEVALLPNLVKRGTQNGLKNLRILNSEEITMSKELIDYTDNIYYKNGIMDKIYYDSSLTRANIKQTNFISNFIFKYRDLEFDNIDSIFYFTDELRFVGSVWDNIYN